jgi:hypothetical protein
MRPRARRTAHRAGFTLLETALAMVIVMVGVVAMIEAQQGFVHSNTWSSHEATATTWPTRSASGCGSCRATTRCPGSALQTAAGRRSPRVWDASPARSRSWTFDDVDDYDGVEFGGNGTSTAHRRVRHDDPGCGRARRDRVDPTTGPPMPLQGWSQSVTVEKVDPYDFTESWDVGAHRQLPHRGQVPAPRHRVTVRSRAPGPAARHRHHHDWVVPAR